MVCVVHSYINVNYSFVELNILEDILLEKIVIC